MTRLPAAEAAHPASPSPLEAVAEPLRAALVDYLDRLRGIAGERLLAVATYGPAGSPGSPGAERLATAVVFNEVDLELLAQIAAHGAHFGKSGIAAPWALTPALIDDSRDSFPLELIEIQEQRMTLLGRDYFADLEFERAHVRLQCERELKSAEMHLQRGLLAAAGNERALGRLGLHLSHSLSRVLRGLLWLHDDRQRRGPFELVAAAETLAGRKLTGVRRALDDSDTATWAEFAELHDDVAALRSLVERLR